MSARVLQFAPLSVLEAHANLAEFIELCRSSSALDARTQFEKNVWDCGRLKAQNTVQRLIFSTLDAARVSAYEPCMAQPFLDFAKAAVTYLQDMRPVLSQGQRIAALRCLEGALQAWNKGAMPTSVNAEILDTAVELARKTLSPATCYRVAGQLKIISELLRAKRIIVLRQSWEHGQKKPDEPGSRISKHALAARQKKLPSAAALRALAGIFNSATETGDVVLSSYCALMLCAPERVNEALRLRENCLVHGDGEFRGKLGLRWRGSKGFEDATKWLPTEMVPVARKAIENLIKASSKAREIAVWYTANPRRIFIHNGAKHLAGKHYLTTPEIALLLWGDERLRSTASIWAYRTRKLKRIHLHASDEAYWFADVEKAVLSLLPPTFPFVPGDSKLLCKDSLAMTLRNSMSRVKTPYLCMFGCVSFSALDNRFCTSKDTPSVFEKFEYKEDDGSKIEFHTHSLRHYLNTLAQNGGLSSAEIAIFSGRRDAKQNRAYDHMTSDEIQAPISAALKGGFTSELEPGLIARGSLVNRAEFNSLGLLAAHTTRYGWCAHDFASEPCQMYRDCINCEEQECIKGDAHKEANLLQLRSEIEYLLKRAREALTAEEYGADTWVEHQSRTLERVNALLSILEDPAVPLGARVRLDLTNVPLIATNAVHPVGFVQNTRRKEFL